MDSFHSTRRQTLAWLAGGIALSACAAYGGSALAQAQPFKVRKTPAQWRAQLTEMQYFVLREEGTERAYSSALDKEKRAGTFLCAGCSKALFSSQTKYDSGTGWPSFYRPLAGAVGLGSDRKLGYVRNSVHCADCGGHLGHVFNDGPRPTGKRYCMNGVAMRFQPA